ncbi:hypothetical protein PN417_14570 [Halorubrum ezzemoulense]|uniref:hypothetical protein n=1 Tax=Halorubrum ezzemoulense TaxID=337243 RepID=UPI00232E80AE|nr:hypothetical protein [Halorubrum ezzemoulense]MDB9302154.1 hypothetical protein [Halorubrum ezzemoulense]
MRTTNKKRLLKQSSNDKTKDVLKATPKHVLNYDKHDDRGGPADGYAYSIVFDIRDEEANRTNGLYVGETKRPFLERLKEHVEKGIKEKVDKLSSDKSLDPNKSYIYSPVMLHSVRSVSKDNIPTNQWSLKQELSHQESNLGHSEVNNSYFDVILGAK